MFDPSLHHRRSIRLHDYNYAAAGAYFFTLCTQQRTCLFGDVVQGQMQVNAAGWMLQSVWNDMPHHYPLMLDAFVVMPNHVHGILWFEGKAFSLSDAIHRYKTLTTTRYTGGIKEQGWPPYMGRLWQRNYHEHIVRSENNLRAIREYIECNPANWLCDRDNPNIDPFLS